MTSSLSLSGLLAALIGGASAATPAHNPASCAFDDRIAREILSYRDCGWLDASGRPHVKTKYWRRFKFDAHGLASASIGGGWYWFHRSGRSAPTMLFDNWAEDFRNGLVRSPRGDRIGFVDQSLRLIIPARYDGALPFEHGVAEACRGCRPVQYGEHSVYEGGTWVCVDRGGREWPRKGRNC